MTKRHRWVEDGVRLRNFAYAQPDVSDLKTRRCFALKLGIRLEAFANFLSTCRILISANEKTALFWFATLQFQSHCSKYHLKLSILLMILAAMFM